MRVMYKKLKKNINIPRYEYGSLAIMTFYNESLSNLIGYGELRTNVFHQFAQIGNAIIFGRLLEQTLVRSFLESLFFDSELGRKVGVERLLVLLFLLCYI